MTAKSDEKKNIDIEYDENPDTAETTVDDNEPMKQQIEKLQLEIEDLREVNRECEQKYMRTLAEFNNFKKRKEKVYAEMAEKLREDLLIRYIDVLDNFDRALDSCPIDENNKSYIEGFRMIANQMLDFLKSENVKPIDSIGEPMDPNRHEAVSVVPKDDLPQNTVVEVCQKGYCRGDKTIRPAKVIVSKQPD